MMGMKKIGVSGLLIQGFQITGFLLSSQMETEHTSTLGSALQPNPLLLIKLQQ